MPYSIRLPDGALVQNIPDDLPPEEAKRRIIAAGLVKPPPPPETTIFGSAKELVKGLVPGAVGLLESAATGASALLPEEYEKTAREKIASIAGAVKAPFAAAPGYEESIPRKLSEAIGSTAPFLLAGPLGLAGRVGAVGLGVGAGAGEARTRAEKEGATAEQRGTATALGVIPGAFEVFAPFRILSRIPDAATAQGVQLVKRALVAGGEEAAQEAASGFAQNLIAKGVYKPEQELIEGLGEQAAYGGATGAIVQGLMDLALGRRARGAQAAKEPTAIDVAEQRAAEKAALPVEPPPAAEAPPAPPAEPAAEAPPAPPAEPAAEAPPAPPAEPAAEAPPAPPAEPAVSEVAEPIVRKPDEAPTVGMQAADIEALGISKKQPIYRRMLGKDLENPEQRAAVLADIENYLTKGLGSEESRTKLTEFKERFAPPSPPITPSETEAPSVPSVSTEPEAGRAGAPVVGKPSAGTAPEGVGAVEPTGVVRPVADVEQLVGGEGAPSVAITAPVTGAPVTETPTAPKEKVLKGSVETRVKALDVNAAIGGVPDPNVIRNTLESINEPKMARAVLYYLGVDQDGNFLVGANNLPQTPSAQEAGQMAGLGQNSGDRVKKVAKALGITGDIRKKYQASQTDLIVTGKAVSEAGTGADVEPAKTGLITAQTWYEPIARKGLEQANDTELSRAAVKADRFLENPANEPVHAALMAEVKKRANRPEFRAALKKEFGIASEEVTVEEGTPGAEAAIEEEGGEEPTYRTIPQSPVVTNRASHAELEKVVADIGKALGGEIAVTILDDVTDVDAKQKPGSRAGATIKGGIYLFRSGIAKGVEGQKTVFHELFHKGLKNLLPEAEYRAMMNKFYSQSAEIRAMADAYLASETGQKDTANLSKEDAQMLAVEESLADVAEQTDLKPTLIRQIANFLARVADRVGMPQLARAIRTMGLNEQEKFIHDALQAGMGPSKPGEGETRFRTATAKELMRETEDIDIIGDRKRETLAQRTARRLEGNPALKLRMAFADSMAPLENFFVESFGGALRSQKGTLNPMVLLSRALDALRVSKAVQEQGGLRKQDGLLVASEILDAEGNVLQGADGKPLNYVNVLSRITDAAKAEGSTYDRYRKAIDTVLYGHREYNLRAYNRELEAQAEALENAGKAKEATRVRNDIVTLALTNEEIDKLEAQFQKDKFIQGVSKDLDTIRFNLLDTLVEAGRISEDKAQEWKDNTGYIPFERIGEYDEVYTSGRGVNRGAAALKNIRRFEGSERQTTSVVENFSKFVDWATKEAIKNDASLHALKTMELLGAAQRREEKPSKDAPGSIVTVFEDGEQVSFYVPDPAHVVTFSIVDPQVPDSLKWLQKSSQILRAGVTSLPPFAIKQVFDDIVRAYSYAGVKNNAALVKSVLLNFPKNWFNEIFKIKPAGVRELESLGIVGTFDFSQQTNLKNILAEAGAKKEGLGSTILRVMEAGAKASDLAVRQAIYEQVKKETGDIAAAESAAREIINFSRRGSSKLMGTLISVIPFFNAYARGMDKLATAAAGKVVGQTTGTARSMFYKRMSVLTTMGLLYALMMQDDEEYQALPDHVRDTNWVLPYGKELGFTPVIPVPAELAFFFKAIPERVVRYYKLYGTDEEQAAVEVLGELVRRGIDVFSSPNITPQALRPFVENMMNHSWFLNRPLESQSQLKLRPFERYGTGTSDAMKALAIKLEDAANATGFDAFAISPIKLENAIRGIFGSAAGIGLSLADSFINPNRTDRPIHQQLGFQLTGLSAVAKDPVGTRQLDSIYKFEEKVEQTFNTHNRLLNTNPDKANQFIAENVGLYEVREPLRSLMDSIRALNADAMLINRETSLPPDERRKLIDQLRVQQNDLARQVLMLRKLARDIQMRVK